MAETRRIFGLSIDEELVWASAETDGANITNVQINSMGFIQGDDIGEQICSLLRAIGRRELESFDGFGISTIGVVDSGKGRLVSLARKSWERESDEFIIDFRKLLSTFVSDSDVPVKRLIVQNDATAAALSELVVMRQKDPDCDRLLYLTFNEGVNGGIVYYDRPLATGCHPEMGHIRPALHQNDPAIYGNSEFDRKKQTGCPIHGRCFEGVASGARIRHSWGGKKPSPTFSLQDLPLVHIAWQLEAFYIAQLCMIGALTISPYYIVIGGHVMNETLLQLVRVKFRTMDGNYFLPAYMMNEELIQQSYYGEHVNVRGALELARMAAYERQSQKLSLAWSQ